MITDTAIHRLEQWANESRARESRANEGHGEDGGSTAQRPFFMGVGLHKPHTPWVMPQRFLDMQLALNDTDVASRDVPPQNYCNASLYICDNVYTGLPWEPAAKTAQQGV
jgi:hypothetical protein